MNRRWYRRWLVAPSVILLVAAAVAGVWLASRPGDLRGSARAIDRWTAAAVWKLLR